MGAISGNIWDDEDEDDEDEDDEDEDEEDEYELLTQKL
jgi:hypothetical protein